jgi:hypothetical protein
MAIRVDNKGFLIDQTGKQLEKGNSAEEVAKRFAKIVDAWEKNHKGDKDGPPAGTPMYFTERGDCIWRMATGAGSDEIRSSFKLNKQFDDPNLIHPGDIVFVDRITQLSADRKQQTNVDMFRDQMAGWTPATPAEQAEYKQVADSYLATTYYQPALVGPIVAPGSDVPWTDTNKAGRQQILTSYFSHIDTDRRPVAAVEIAGAPDSDTLLLRDVKTSLAGVGGPAMPGTKDSREGPRVTTYAAAGATGNEGVFRLEYKQHLSDVLSGHYYRGNGKNQAIEPPIDMGMGQTFSMQSHMWWSVENEMTTFVKGAPAKVSLDLMKSLLNDPQLLLGDQQMASQGRKFAVSGYLRAFEDPKVREDKKNQLLEGVTDPAIKADIEEGMKWSQRKISGIDY